MTLATGREIASFVEVAPDLVAFASAPQRLHSDHRGMKGRSARRNQRLRAAHRSIPTTTPSACSIPRRLRRCAAFTDSSNGRLSTRRACAQLGTFRPVAALFRQHPRRRRAGCAPLVCAACIMPMDDSRHQRRTLDIPIRSTGLRSSYDWRSASRPPHARDPFSSGVSAPPPVGVRRPRADAEVLGCSAPAICLSNWSW